MAVVDTYIQNNGKVVHVQRDTVNHGKQTIRSLTRLQKRIHKLDPFEIGGLAAAVSGTVGGAALSIVYDFKGIRTALAKAGHSIASVSPSSVWNGILTAANVSFVAGESTRLKNAPAAVKKFANRGKEAIKKLYKKSPHIPDHVIAEDEVLSAGEAAIEGAEFVAPAVALA